MPDLADWRVDCSMYLYMFPSDVNLCFVDADVDVDVDLKMKSSIRWRDGMCVCKIVKGKIGIGIEVEDL